MSRNNAIMQLCNYVANTSLQLGIKLKNVSNAE